MTRFDKWLAVALLALAVFNGADYFLTLSAVEMGFPEGNFYMDSLIGTPWFFLVKVVLVPAGLVIIWAVRRKVRRPVFAGVGIAVLAYAWVTVYHLVHQAARVLRC